MGFTLFWKLLIYASYLGIAWIVFHIFVRRDYQAHGKLSPIGVFLEILILALHGMMSYLYLNSPNFKTPPLEPYPVRNGIAFLLMAIGLAGVIFSMTKLGYLATFGQEGNNVRREGFYRYIRNPQLVLYGVLLLGYALLWPRWEALVWGGCYLFAAHQMVLIEEEYLTNKYGDEYRRYCREVPRYFPKIGKSD